MDLAHSVERPLLGLASCRDPAPIRVVRLRHMAIIRYVSMLRTCLTQDPINSSFRFDHT